jgi:agmatine deiminase
MTYRMPPEWAPHERCWMAWPCREGMWSSATETCQNYADVAHAIREFEPVTMLVPPALTAHARSFLGADIDLFEVPIDDSWARDSGPTFVVDESGSLAGVSFRFNAWGEKYQPYDQDALMGSRILECAGVREYTSKLVAEGGGVTVDGEGTVITTETCFLNPNRNPNWTRAEVEAELCRTLGAEKVIWIPGDVTDTETDGHIDGIAAFIEPGRLLVEVNSDKTDPHYEIGQINYAALKNQKDAKGREIQLEFIQEGSYHPGVWNGGCSSYVNTYLANGAVIVSGYGYEHDGAAVETYRKLYPEREIVQVPIHDIAVGGGGVHCITQQQPAPSA